MRPQRTFSEDSKCTEWPGCKNAHGYGLVRRNGKTLLAHRHEFAKAFGPIPRGMFVLHRCDNRSCVNTEHLFLGTQGDNMRDMAEKGRGAYRNKLSPTDVEDIRGLLLIGAKQVAVARAYGVHDATINAIARGRAWVGVALVLAALVGCAYIPRPDAYLNVVNAPGKKLTGYNLKTDFDDSGEVRPGAHPRFTPAPDLDSLNKYVCSSPSDFVKIKAYIKKLREQYDKGCQNQ